MLDLRAVQELPSHLKADLVARVVAVTSQEHDREGLSRDRRMRKPHDGVVVELAHHVEGGPVLGVLVPLSLHATRHYAHHARAVREDDPTEQLLREPLCVVGPCPLVHALLEL